MIDIPSLLYGAFINAVSGIVGNIFYILLFVWAIRRLRKDVPKWLDQYERIKINERAVEIARKSMAQAKA